MFFFRLANSHAAGVLHNDVASRNALLSTPGPGGRGLVCDFGLSRLVPEDGVEKAFLIDAEGGEDLWPVQQMPCESLAHPYPLTPESDTWMYGLFLHEVGGWQQRALFVLMFVLVVFGTGIGIGVGIDVVTDGVLLKLVFVTHLL